MRHVFVFLILILVSCTTERNLERGQAALEAENWDAACRAFQPVVDSRWPAQNAYYGLASAKISMGDTAAAQEAIEQWLSIDPMDWHAHLRAGQLALSRGRREEAALHLITSRLFCEYADEIQEVEAWLAKLRPPAADKTDKASDGSASPSVP